MSQIRRIVLEELQKMSWYSSLARSPQGVQQSEQGYALWWQIFGPLFGVSIIGAVTNVITRPLAALPYWLIYGVLAYLFARLLGGRGTIAQTIGLSSLAAAPHILDVLNPILGLVPTAGGYLSSLVGLVAFGWGGVIYGKGTAVAHEISAGKAVVAMLLPIILGGLLAVLVLTVFALSIAMGGR